MYVLWLHVMWSQQMKQVSCALFSTWVVRNGGLRHTWVARIGGLRHVSHGHAAATPPHVVQLHIWKGGFFHEKPVYILPDFFTRKPYQTGENVVLKSRKWTKRMTMVFQSTHRTQNFTKSIIVSEKSSKIIQKSFRVERSFQASALIL